MSSIGKKPIPIPTVVIVKIAGNSISVKGSKGELQKEIHPGLAVEVKTLTEKSENKSEVVINPRVVSEKLSALWGLERSLVANMIEGVNKGFEKKLEFEGIGYRANVEGDILIMQLGFSHPVRLKAPPSIKFSVAKNVITVSGIDKGRVGEVAERVRTQKPPEPYKGKGIRYLGEIVRRKVGKKAVAAS
jgi:large subunit ribosomal protein L6